jgi:RNA-directed DNA polymerase
MGDEESERATVPEKPGNAVQADPVEGKARRHTEPFGGEMTETPCSTSICTRFERVAKLAREAPNLAFTTLAHHIDLVLLKEAYRRTRKSGTPGVDRQTAEQYSKALEENLRSLLDRAKAGTYRAPPVRRVHIPKGDGDTRPIGIPTFEDKVLQRAVSMVLEAVYEQDFLDCSHGFRPRRSAHQALEALWSETMKMRGGWVLEIDVRKFFDTLDHEHLQVILRQRIRDGVLLRLIGKWLKAGVLDEGELHYPEAGSPQGGVISPLLANVYLHEVLDVWFEKVVRPRLAGEASLVRYADDAVIVFETEADARRVLEVLPKRFGKYGLTLHEDKTRLVRFLRPPRGVRPCRADRPSTFDFLGFTHHWRKSLRGNWVVKQTTAKDRFRRSLARVVTWCREHRHDDVREQHRGISAKLRGHYAYFGLRGNYAALARFRFEIRRAWRKWLCRRSSAARRAWDWYAKFLERYPLPPPRVLNPALLSSPSEPV